MSTSSRPSLSQLRAFVALCDYQHFGEAANALGVSQPSLSQAITALEKRAGAELVERTTRRVLVTTLGETLLPYAREVIVAADAFNDAMVNQGETLSGNLSLGLIPTLAPYFAPIILDHLTAELPQIQPELRELVTGDVLEMLERGSLDAAVIAIDVDTQRAAAIPMFDEPLVAIVPSNHAWVGRTDLTIAELDEEELLLLDESNCLRDQTLALCQRYSAQPPTAVATTLSTVVRMVAHGAGVTVVPAGSLQLIENIEGCEPVYFKDNAPVRRIGLVHRSSSSRKEDFELLAKTLTELCRKANLPMVEIS